MKTVEDRDVCLLEKTSGTCNQEDFRPAHLIFEWVEPGTTTRRHKVSVVLPSGIYPGPFSVRAFLDHHELDVVVALPDPLVDLNHQNQKWLDWKGSDRIETSHCKLFGFKQILKSYKSSSIGSVKSTARIKPPLQVQTHIAEPYNIKWLTVLLEL